MCAKMGITLNFSQVYNHRTNGRAERAGKQLIERLRKLSHEERLTWVELLPTVLDKYHDVPNESGYSPYFILFGRHRPLPRLPYEIPHEALDALDFFQEMERRDQVVAKRLNDLHAKEAERLNQNMPQRAPLHKGDKVWYKRPENSGDKLDTPWLGPCTVTQRVGEESYEIEVKGGHVICAPRRFLAPYLEDVLTGTTTPLHAHLRTPLDEWGDPDTWEAEAIVGHSWDGEGNLLYHVKWQGFPPEENNFEPVTAFVPVYNDMWAQYNTRHKLWGLKGAQPSYGRKTW